MAPHSGSLDRFSKIAPTLILSSQLISIPLEPLSLSFSTYGNTAGSGGLPTDHFSLHTAQSLLHNNLTRFTLNRFFSPSLFTILPGLTLNFSLGLGPLWRNNLFP
ncbi:putative protein binding protein [Corchorus olitorius]|uniref:Uncharacterized protein n=1 Tax=Corchorus olitorius TaxID=93759 RepID=A0A1R3G1V7_9ROSI|nr:putative protein binding protein [Corchorus olitorius]